MASTTVSHGQTSTRKQDTKQDALDQFLRDLQKAEQKHRDRCRRYDTFDAIYNASWSDTNRPYRQIVGEDGEWRSQLHPAYAFEVIQTEIAMLLDDTPIASVTPPKGKLDADAKAKAQAYENKINEDRKADRYEEKQAKNHLQALVYGVSAIKSGWEYDHAKIRTQTLTPTYGGLPQRTIADQDRTITNRPTITVCNMRDVMWDPAATAPDEITFIFHRTYETLASLLAMQEMGIYENVDDVTVSGGQGSMSERPGYRDLKGLVEVLEEWKLGPDGVQLTTVANRNIVMRDEPSPLLLDGKTLPFSFVVPTPQLGRVEGKSECELVADQQIARWRIQNQMIDSGEMIINPPIFAKDNIEDPDEIVWATGKLNLLPASGGPLSEQLYFPSLPTTLLTAGQEMLQMLEQDMESVTGVSGYLSGAPTDAVDPRTATEVQNVTQGGQRRVLMKKQRFADQERQIGSFQLQLMEQLAPDVIPAYGPQGEPMPLRISDIIGCCYEVEDADESLNRQERRTEAALVLNTLGALAAIPQVAMGLNWRYLLENYFEANDIDPGQALAAPPQAPPMAPGGLASPVGAPGVAPGPMPITPPQGGAGGPGLSLAPGGQAA